MFKSELGKYFIKDNEIYQAIGYTEDPTMELKNIVTGQTMSVVVNSPLADNFKKLVAIPAKYGFYETTGAEEIENIVINNHRKESGNNE